MFMIMECDSVADTTWNTYSETCRHAGQHWTLWYME